MTGREKWYKFIAGEDVGPMVSPLCDKWAVGDAEYAWSAGCRDGAGGGDAENAGDCGAVDTESRATGTPEWLEENHKQFAGQIMMARTFGWDPNFIAAVRFHPTDASLEPEEESETLANGGVRTKTTIRTPLGELTHISIKNGITESCVKDFLTDRSDFEKMIWYAERTMDFDREAALADGRRLRGYVGELGVLGTWVSPSASLSGIETLYYHLADYPLEFMKLYEARRERQKLYLDVYREAGFDFMFYCVNGTDSTSPSFFDAWQAEETRETISRWKASGGFTLWHSCGHIKAFVERGMYNEMLPEVFETLSEPPVGNIPSLSWARKRLDRRIITKGNIPLNILLEDTEEDVRAAVRRVCDQTAGFRHIIGLSDNVLNGTPKANLHAFVDESRRYRV